MSTMGRVWHERTMRYQNISNNTKDKLKLEGKDPKSKELGRNTTHPLGDLALAENNQEDNLLFRSFVRTSLTWSHHVYPYIRPPGDNTNN